MFLLLNDKSSLYILHTSPLLNFPFNFSDCFSLLKSLVLFQKNKYSVFHDVCHFSHVFNHLSFMSFTAFCFLRFLFLGVLILKYIVYADSYFGSSFKKWDCFSGERSSFCVFWVVEAFIRTVSVCFVQVSNAV